MPSVYVRKPKYKTIKCTSCPNTTTVGIKHRSPWRCLECTLRHMFEYQRQMHEHSGPLYDEWLARMRQKFATPGSTTQGSTIENSPSRDDT